MFKGLDCSLSVCEMAIVCVLFLVSFLGGPVFLWDGWGGSGGRVRVGQEGREFGKHDQFQD